MKIISSQWLDFPPRNHKIMKFTKNKEETFKKTHNKITPQSKDSYEKDTHNYEKNTKRNKKRLLAT